MEFSVGTVKRAGKLFRAGVYADKGVEFTSDDVKRMVSNFSPVPVKVEHMDTIFDGKLGSLTEVYADPSGEHLFGAVEWPEWMETVLADTDKKVSIRTDENKTKISEVSLVMNPRIPDANVNSLLKTAFSNWETKETGDDMNEQETESLITRMLEKMGFKGGGGAPVDKVDPKFSESKEYLELKAKADKADALENQVKAIQTSRIEEKAAGFADRQFNVGKCTKEERDLLFAQYKQAFSDDEAARSVGYQFSDTAPTRVSMIEKYWDAKQSSPLTQEMVQNGGFMFTDRSEPDDLKELQTSVSAFAARMNGKGGK